MKATANLAGAPALLQAHAAVTEQERAGVRTGKGSRMRWIGASLVALIVLAVALNVLMTNVWWTGLARGVAAPDFRARDLYGEEIRLSDSRGRPVMLTFWSPDCSACREELPALQAIAAAPGAELVLLTVVRHPSAVDVKDFVDQQGLTFPVLMDEDSTVTDLYQVHGVPFTYFIDAEGRVEGKVIGAGTPGALHSQLSAWLKTCQVGVVCQE